MQNKSITLDEALNKRAAITTREFSQLFGNSEIDTYRKISAGVIPVIPGMRKKLIPRSYYAPLIGEV